MSLPISEEERNYSAQWPVKQAPRREQTDAMIAPSEILTTVLNGVSRGDARRSAEQEFDKVHASQRLTNETQLGQIMQTKTDLWVEYRDAKKQSKSVLKKVTVFGGPSAWPMHIVIKVVSYSVGLIALFLLGCQFVYNTLKVTYPTLVGEAAENYYLPLLPFFTIPLFLPYVADVVEDDILLTPNAKWRWKVALAVVATLASILVLSQFSLGKAFSAMQTELVEYLQDPDGKADPRHSLWFILMSLLNNTAFVWQVLAESVILALLWSRLVF